MLNNPMSIEDILPAGDYATDSRCGFSQLSNKQQKERDLLKILSNEYMRYLFDPESVWDNSTSPGKEKINKPHNIETLCTDSTKTVTDYILGERQFIDVILNELPIDEWNNKVFFGEGKINLMQVLSPLDETVKSTDSSGLTELSLLRVTGIDSCI